MTSRMAAGNDTFYVDSLGDTVVDGVDAGNDKIIWTESTATEVNLNNINDGNIENLDVSNAAAVITLKGTSGNNTLTGNILNNVLAGSYPLDGSSSGTDKLIGGLGDDLTSWTRYWTK